MSDLEIVQELCVRAGMIMEDASVAAVSRMSADPVVRRATITELRVAAADIHALIAAADFLERRLAG
jgi:hypothetical protein